MSLQKFFENLQARPESEKKRILLVTTSVITGMIFFAWISTFSVVPLSGEPKEKNILAEPEPSVLDQAGIFLNDIKLGFFEVSASVGSLLSF